MRPKRVLALAGVVVCGLIAWKVLQLAPAPPATADPKIEVARNEQARTSRRVKPALTADKASAMPSSVSSGPGAPAAPGVLLQKPPSPQSRIAAGPKGKEPIKDPLAREALAWVGLDQEAEAYWMQAINDPGLSAQERQDLIEDLNEDGLSDPKHPTAMDLPLILNRLQLIEWLAPAAMDSVNADAFLEAYKDLVNLAEVAMGAGEPVR